MPDALAEELIATREEARNTKRQLGELDRVTGIQVRKEGTIKLFVKQYIVYTRETNCNPIEGLIHCYHFDEGTGITIGDDFGNDGTVIS